MLGIENCPHDHTDVHSSDEKPGLKVYGSQPFFWQKYHYMIENSHLRTDELLAESPWMQVVVRQDAYRNLIRIPRF